MKDSTQPHLFNVCYVNIYDDCGVHCETEFCESDPGKKSIWVIELAFVQHYFSPIEKSYQSPQYHFISDI